MKSLPGERRFFGRLIVGIGVGLSLSACAEEAEQETSPEVLLERATAFRMACAASVLEQTAAEDLEVLEATVQYYQEGDTATGGALPMTNAAVTYARGYLQHAEVRAAGYAMLDSAYNYATTPEDSLRFDQRAREYGIRPPAEGTLERNVLEAYQNDLANILEDDDHRCNWDIPGLEDPS